QGGSEAACSGFDALEQHIGAWGVAAPSHVPYAADAIAAYLAADRPGDAARVVGRLASCRLPSRWPAAMAAAGRAALAVHEGDLKTAEAALAESVDLLRDVPMPLAQGRTLTAYGAVLTRHGERDKARPFLSDALVPARRCGP